MAARFEDREGRWVPVLPEMAKEVIFWCAVLVAVVSGAVLIGHMDAVWRFPIPAAQSASVAATVEASPVAERPAMPASETPILDASEPAEQPPTF